MKIKELLIATILFAVVICGTVVLNSNNIKEEQKMYVEER